MNNTLLDDTLYAEGITVLEDRLGPVQTLRFLALISRQPFDYQQWRQQNFGKMNLAEILTKAQALSEGKTDQI
ncbi:MAG: hypothetical protein NT075_29025 [Chloroflexi bacterium]|nr:hypothetical protein [Chloroflexota bacterium]